MEMTKRLFVISLGQGQGPLAESMFNDSMANGSWIFFQVSYEYKNDKTEKIRTNHTIYL